MTVAETRVVTVQMERPGQSGVDAWFSLVFGEGVRKKGWVVTEERGGMERRANACFPGP